MNRRFLKQVLLFALLYYAIFLLLGGLIFLLSHLPPKAVNLDPLILALFKVQHVLAWPRFLLIGLWPGEMTPGYLNLLSMLLACFVWGLLLAWLKNLWVKIRT